MNKVIGIDLQEGDMISLCNVYFSNGWLTQFP